MSHRCCDGNELAALGALPPDDPRRREAAACPRCGSLLAALDTFLAGDDGLPADEVQRAGARLSEFVTGQLAPAARKRSGGTAGRLAPWQRWGAGAALAAAAVLVLTLVVDVPLGPNGPSGTVRGGGAIPAVIDGVSIAERSGARTGFDLRWPRVDGAEQYEIIVFSAALDTLAVLGPFDQPAAEVPDGLLAAGDGAFCRVRALAEGAAIAASGLQALTAR